MNDGIYLSKKEILLAIVEKGQSSRRYKLGEFWELNFEEIREALDDVPAADVRPVVRGEWLAYPILDDMCYQHYSCSVCKRVEAIPHGYDVKKELPFCHCGADMREVTP